MSMATIINNNAFKNDSVDLKSFHQNQNKENIYKAVWVYEYETMTLGGVFYFKMVHLSK